MAMEDKKREENLEENLEETTDESLKEEGSSEEFEEVLDDGTEDLEESIDEEVEDLKNTLVRLQADFNNYKKRTEKEKSDVQKYACSSLMENLLEVLDNFDRAIENSQVEEEVLEGFELINKQLIDILKAEGLEEIESDGKEFDPNFHNAVLMEESDQESGRVIETLQKGYKHGDRILRPSMVKVSK